MTKLFAYLWLSYSRLKCKRLIVTGVAIALLTIISDRADAQTAPTVPLPAATASADLFFADVIVRGQPVFQIGGLSDLSATSRAAIVNRRIASILSQSQIGHTITVQPDRARSIATLQINNRVLMTVTQQDAQDFNTPVETLAQQWANQLNQAFDQPPLAIDVGQRLLLTLRELQRDAIDRLPALMSAFLVLIVTWILAAMLRQVMLKGARHWQVDRNSKVLVGRLGYGGVWTVGAIVALSVLGLDFTALVGTLGLTSVVIGFSLRDVLSNYFSGVILLASRPFRLGDQVRIKEYEGTVTQIQLRATTIKTYDGRVVYIPNQEVFNASIINNTASEIRCSTITVNVDYGTDITTAKQIIDDAVLQVAGVVSDPPPNVLVSELATNAIKLQVAIWVNSRRRPFLETTSQAAQAMKEALQQAKVEISSEVYTIQLRGESAIASSSQPPLDRLNSHLNPHRTQPNEQE